MSLFNCLFVKFLEYIDYELLPSLVLSYDGSSLKEASTSCSAGYSL